MKSALSLFLALVFAPAALASFHFMQVEQVIGGVDGDVTAQAVQLRMRSAGQNLVSNARLRAWDAAGLNPVMLLDMASNVTGSGAGARVLLATPAFTTKVQALFPAFAPDFTLANPIPSAYLAAGRLTFEDDFGTIYWSLAWGGAGYTGSHTGNVTNDTNGNFGPAFGAALPAANRQALQFPGTAAALSTTNVADYALTAGAATVVKNNGTSFSLALPPAEIVVEQPAGTDLVDGTASVNFGAEHVGSRKSRAFTIKNTGGLNLTGLGIVIDGADAGDFVVSVSPVAPVGGSGGSTTFTVRFAPTTLGARNAALHLSSNDANESPFDIGLTGTGAGALRISSVVRSGGNVTITFPTVAERSYTLSQNDTLSGVWTDTGQSALSGNGSNRTFTLNPIPAVGLTKRYYRVQSGP